MSNEWKSDDLNAIKTLDEAASVIRTMKDPEARIRATLDYAREGTANTDYLESEEHAEPHSQKFRKLRDALEMIDGLAMQYLREHPENQETELMHLFQAERSALSSHGDEIYYLVNLRAAERRIDKSREGNMNDPEIGARYVRAVNALVEVHAVRGNFEKAREVIEEYLHPDFQKEALVTIAKEVAKRIKKKETSPDE